MFTIKGFQFKHDDHCIGLSTKNLENDVTVADLILYKKKYEYNKIRTVVLDYVYEDHDKDKYDITMSFSCGDIVDCGEWIVERIKEYINKEKNERGE